MTINSLAFGQTAIEFDLPAGKSSQILPAQKLPPLQDPKNALLRAFEHLVNSPPLYDIISCQDEMIAKLLSDYRLNGTTALSVLTKSRQTRIPKVTDLVTELVTRMGMIPAAGIDEAIVTAQQWLHKNFDMCILPNGSLTLPEVVSNDQM